MHTEIVADHACESKILNNTANCLLFSGEIDVMLISGRIISFGTVVPSTGTVTEGWNWMDSVEGIVWT